jgi:hypothetical protein
MLHLLISTSLKYMLIHKGPNPAQREFRVKKRQKKRWYLNLICLSYSRNISEQLVKRNTSTNTTMRRWSSNPSITNIMMKSLLTSNPMLTYRHTFRLCLLERGNHNNLASSPTTSTRSSRVATKIVTIIDKCIRGFGVRAISPSLYAQYKTGWKTQ